MYSYSFGSACQSEHSIKLPLILFHSLHDMSPTFFHLDNETDPDGYKDINGARGTLGI
jgi:hypothetical protein